MARGKDESNNPRRRPQRPQTDEEKMAIVKQVFPNAQEVNVNENEEMDMDDDDYDYIDEGGTTKTQTIRLTKFQNTDNHDTWQR